MELAQIILYQFFVVLFVECPLPDVIRFCRGVYITDSDCHSIYDRATMGRAEPVRLGRNVWVGDSAIVCKGVTIGDNSIIGAGAIVVSSIPANCVAVGNPARVVKELDPNETFTTRAHFYADPARLAREFMLWEQAVLKGNTIFGWLRHTICPRRDG